MTDVLEHDMKPFRIKEGIAGFLFAGVAAGIKKGKKDLGLLFCNEPCSAAGVFTQNRVKAAPVIICKKRLVRGTAQAVLVNSGNANACTGDCGLDAAEKTCTALSSHLRIRSDLVLPCSTGVIGENLPAEKITRAVPCLVSRLSVGSVDDFSEAILTTDTYKKIVALEDVVNGHRIKVMGVAKGAGMIMPDMATMLAFVLTDACVEGADLAEILSQNVEKTFNRITVDGDMSTNDTVLALANGRSGACVSGKRSSAYKSLNKMVFEVMKRLSVMIVQDGEGATKLVTVKLLKAKTKSDAEKAAFRVSNSPLVKTAFFGEDFNWGRIMAALGSSGAIFDPEKVDIYFNGIQAVAAGQAVQENIKKLKKTVKKKEIILSIDLNAGKGNFEVVTCDLTFDYVKINAEYTT